MSEEQIEELQDSIYDARNSNVINISDLTSDDRDMMLAFARRLDTMDPMDKEKIKKLLGR